MEQKFKLWLEFEEVDPENWDIENEFCNIQVDLEDGRHYGLMFGLTSFCKLQLTTTRKPDRI